MSAENPWEDVPRAILESQLLRQAAQIAKLIGEVRELENVVNAQMAFAAETPPLPLHSRAGWPASPADSIWYIALVIKLQDLLARECGRRDPEHIDNHTLRALTEHILGGAEP
jgi:hypothetical protein